MKKAAFVVCLMLALLASAALACNFPGGEESEDPNSLATYLAQTLAAQPTQALPTVEAPAIETSTQAPLPGDTPAPTEPSPDASPTPTLDTAPGARQPAAVQLDGEVYSYGLLKGGKFLVTLQFSAPPAGTFSALVDDKEFECEVLARYPNRLYCTGPDLTVGRQVTVLLIDVDTQQTVFQGEFRVPPKATPQPTEANPTPYP